MLLSSVLPVLAVGLSSFGLTKGEPIPTITATPTALAERQLSTIKATTCATGTSGVVSPAPSGAVCGVAAVSNGGVTIVSYTSGANIQSLATCGKVCLETSGCTNLYFALNQYCNLHSGAETHVASSTSIYSFYDATCFSCSALTTTTTTTPSAAASCTTNAVGLASPQPSGAVCDVLAHSNGGTTIISYTSGQYVLSLANCKDICLTTVACTNLYYVEGQYCNLHSGTETHVAGTTDIYSFYDTSCFICPSLCTLASPQPTAAVCDVLAYSNGGVTIISYTSGPYIESLSACGEICLGTSNCTNLYFAQGQYCNLHSGAETHVANSASPFAFYDASCFSCPGQSSSSQTTTSSTTSISSKTSTSTLATTTSLTSPSTSTPQGIPWTSIETNPALYNMAVTTTFTQPPECTGEHVTQMAWHGTNLWENAINPVATSTITNCYPSQFYSSVMGAINSVALPAFSPLVCPSGWSANMYNSTYGVCCPRGFGVNAPYYTAAPDRPFSGAACTSTFAPYELYDITSYDSTAYWTVVPTSAPSEGTFVRVNAFDGIITGLATSATSATSTTSACATPAATVSVTFQVPYAVTDSADGEIINLIGSTPELGSWVPENSIPMSPALYTSSNPLWDITVGFAAGTYVEYKYLHYLADGSYTWSADPNYNLTVSSGCSSTQVVKNAWR